MKKTITIILLSFLSVLCAFFAASCGEKPIELEKPEFRDIRVDVTDRPRAFSIGDYTFESVRINGEKLTADKYIVKNGYFIFKVDYYGELGIGENRVSVGFKEDSFEFVLTVVDEVAPMYDMPQENVYYGSALQPVELPFATKRIKWQNFDINYTLTDDNGIVFTASNPNRSELSKDLDAGRYDLEIEIVKGNEEIDEYKGEIFVNRSENLLSETKISDIEYDKSGLEFSFDESVKGLKILKKTAQYGIESRIGIRYDVIKNAMSDGATVLFFRYYSENGFFIDPDTDEYLSLSLSYFKEQTGSGNVGNIANIAVNPTDGTSGSWQTAKVTLTENDSAAYLDFLIFACSGDYFYMRDMYLLYPQDALLAGDYMLYLESEKTLFVGHNDVLQYSFENLNGEPFDGNADYEWSSSDDNVATVGNNGEITAVSEGSCTVTLTAFDGRYSATCNVTVKGFSSINYASQEIYNKTDFKGVAGEYVASEKAIKLTKIAAGISGNHSNMDMPIMDEMRSAKAAGMVMLAFEYKAENIYGNGANTPVIWVMATDGAPATIGSACWLINPVNIKLSEESEWIKAVITFDRDVFDNTAYKYLTFLVGGESGGTVMFRNIEYGTAEDYAEYVRSEQILTLTESVTMEEGDDFDLVYSFTNIDGSDFDGDAGFAWTSSDYAVVTVDNSGKITALSLGTAVITLTALDGKYSATCNVTVTSVDYSAINYAEPTYFGQWNSTGITMEYDDDEQAIKLTKQGANISGSHSHIELSVMDEIRAAKAAGEIMLVFEYKAENIYGEGNNNPVIWVLSTDGTADTIGSAWWLINPVNIELSEEGEWIKAAITFDREVFNNTAYKYLTFLVGGESGGTVMFRNIRYATERDIYEMKNYATVTYVNITDANSIGLEYDVTENAMKITKLYAGISGSHSHARMPIMDEIRAAKATGLTTLTLEYKANENDVLWIMCNNGTDESVGSGCWLVNAITVTAETAGKWNKVEINLDNPLIDEESNEYLMFLHGGTVGSSIYIRNIKLG